MPLKGDGPARRSAVAFVALWVIVGLICWLGYNLAHAVGLGTARRTHAAASPPHPIATRIPAHSRLTLATIFSAQSPSLRGYDRRNLRTLVATGDVIPARSVNYKMVTYNDFLYPFRRTATYLRTGDITLINLESPLINGCPTTTTGMSFCGDPRVVRGLQFAGVDVACTANNHIGNQGGPGILETWSHLQAAGIRPCGMDRTASVTIRGLRFVFLAYNAVGQRFEYAAARRQIQEARRHANVVIVAVHWGKEYVALPTSSPGVAEDDPVRIARWIIDSGADLIVGNHPHHVQGVELYHGRLITYAHGNFAFDQMFTAADCPGDVNFMCSTREGVVGTYTFYGRQLIAVRYRPVTIYDYAQPRWATARESQVILQNMRNASQTLVRMHR